MKSLSIKYRPQTFADVTEQGITTKILTKIVESGNPKNAYLFSGASGCGKTTLARIFANALNKGVGDPIEIDAASNNGVDQVRAIIESANQRSLTGTYKVFIIDEAHAITTAGWQAFLKGIEEPAPYTIYMFCTTEPSKIPATILNRLQRYNISKISVDGIMNRLMYICQQEGFTNYTDTCDLISKSCQGCMRDAITSLDQCSDLSTDLNIENAKYVLGLVPAETMLKLTNFIRNKQEDKIFAVIETLSMQGQDLKQFINLYLDFVLDLSKYIIFNNIAYTNLPAYIEFNQDPNLSVKQTVSFENSLEWCNRLTDSLLEVKAAIKFDTSFKATIEAYLLKICRSL